MMKQISVKWLVPHLMAIGIFLVATLIYCKPALEGNMVEQPDLLQWKGMAQDGFNYQAKYGNFPEWTNSMFGGMPAYQIAFESTAYLPAYATLALSLFLPLPFLYFFLACICFYFLSQVFRVHYWVGILAALGYAFASYNPIIIATGHHTKMVTIAVMPGLLASVWLLYEHRRYWIGFALTALFTSMVVVNNHLQMVYYTLIIMVFMGVAYAITLVKKGEAKHFFIATSLAIGAAVLGALVCAVNLLTTYDYAPESMRGGKNKLVMDGADTVKSATVKGLDADYAFRWSYGVPETFSLLVPNVQGGASSPLGEESIFYTTLIEKVQSRQLDEGTAQQIAQFGSSYWGDQPFTSGPVYLGAVICLLALLGVAARPGMHTWWMLAASAFAIILAWGSNWMALNEFFFNHLPLYNRFRAPSQSLVIPQLLLPILAMGGLQSFFFEATDDKQRFKWLKQTAIMAGAVLLAVSAYYLIASYSSAREADTLKQVAGDQNLGAQLKELFRAAGEDRKALFGSDLLRSFLLVAAAIVILFFGSKKSLKPTMALVLLTVISTADLMVVGKRYLTDDNYVPKEETEVKNYVQKVNPGLAQVLGNLEVQDTSLHYRVFNTTSDPFNDALTSAYVRSVGGYHPAKLSRYQDLIEYQLSKQNMAVFNMLNTKYFVVNGPQGIGLQQNPDAFGAAWLVKQIHIVPNAAAEMKSLDSLNLRDTAIVEAAEKAALTEMPQWDSTASIQLTVSNNDVLEYAVRAPAPQFAVLSEIYYPRGWKAFADGKEIPIIKTNYVLRGVLLPKGTQKLELRFEPESYRTGRMITSAASWAIMVMLVVSVVLYFRNRKTAAA